MEDGNEAGGRRRIGLTEGKRARFLEVLAETGNVRESAAAAAASKEAFYALRERDAVFDARWKAALALGYEAIESQLLAAARGTGEPGTFDPELALNVLRRRDNAVARGPGYGRAIKAKTIPIVEVERVVMARLAAIAKRLRR